MRSKFTRPSVIFCLILWASTLLGCVETEDGSANRNRVNYGIFMKKIATVRISTAEWRNLFMLKLPSVVDVTAHRTQVLCRERRSVQHDPVLRMIEDPSFRVRHCGNHTPFTQVLHQIYDTYQKDRVNLVENIYEIFPDAISTKNRTRVARGLINIIGHLAHQAFGLAEDTQLIQLSQQVSHALASGTSGVTQLQHQVDKLASASKLTNDRIDITNKRLAEIRDQLLGTDVFNHVSLESANRLHLMVIKKLFLAQNMMSHLNMLLTDLKLLASGKLTPEVVTPKQLRATIHNISILLRSKYHGFEILTNQNSYYYTKGKVSTVRLNNSLLLELTIPLTAENRAFDLYQVINFRTPTPNGQHSSRIVGLPNFIAMGVKHRHFIPFHTCPEIVQDAIRIDHQRIFNASNTCILALFEDSSTGIHKFCPSVLYKERIEPTIMRLTGSLILMTNVEQYLLFYSNGSSRRGEGCEFCTIKVPCDCTIVTDTMSLPALLEDCNPNSVLEKKHLVDLNTLIHFLTPPSWKRCVATRCRR